MTRALGWSNRFTSEMERLAAERWSVIKGRTCLDMMLSTATVITGRDAVKGIDAALGRARMPIPRMREIDLRELGGLEAAVAAVAEKLGFPEIEPMAAACGDWGVAHYCGDSSRPDMAEGVVRGSGCWFFRLPRKGVKGLPDCFAEGIVARAWAVG